ncbi:GGDEF domain-containing protein [Thalassovita mangrovi]|uniref:diguanylate cyclase n=1 Tax=Thalassovita mangrovi TaxID=2692236 RepID=A0A6L8LN66_9RHOB|nr:diguanylate cyclase [Thalassovita mangrovi]MYM54589.1 diguanylate cyclase [Thalassovita mangrovi]
MGLCAALALTPIAVSAIGGFLLLDRGVIGPFEDIAERHRYHIVPVQRLNMLVKDTLAPVDEFVNGANPTGPLAYRSMRQQIEAEFAALALHTHIETSANSLLKRAHEDWIAADRSATELISLAPPAGDGGAARLMRQFHAHAAAASDELSAVNGQLIAAIETDHDRALLHYERSLWIMGIAGAVCLLTTVGGISLISRIMTRSVNRLVDGAARFAQGDRDYRIDIQVPPELHRVAEEFNRMIGRIKISETALTDLAVRDSLTRLLNRRAFEEALAETFDRVQRFGETTALLALDIDHFKHINDTYGHAAGDMVLQEIGAILTRNLRSFDRPFRVGGEEFSVLLPGTTAIAARDIADRLREAVERHPFRCGANRIAVTVSIGIAVTGPEMTQASLVEAADAALYEAKLKGRNRVELVPDPGTEGSKVA